MAILSGDQVSYILDQQSIESVQRQFIKFLFEFNDVPYPDRFSTLGLPSSQYCRLRCNLIHIYRMVYNNIELELDFFYYRSTSIAWGHTHKLFKPHAKGQTFLQLEALMYGTIYQNL